MSEDAHTFDNESSLAAVSTIDFLREKLANRNHYGEFSTEDVIAAHGLGIDLTISQPEVGQ